RAGTSTRSGKQCRFHPQSYCGGKTAQDSEFHPGRHSNPRTRSPSHVLVIEQMLSELLCKLLLPLLDSLHRVIHRSEEHTSELQSRENLVCRLLLEKKNKYCRLSL